MAPAGVFFLTIFLNSSLAFLIWFSISFSSNSSAVLVSFSLCSAVYLSAAYEKTTKAISKMRVIRDSAIEMYYGVQISRQTYIQT